MPRSIKSPNSGDNYISPVSIVQGGHGGQSAEEGLLNLGGVRQNDTQNPGDFLRLDEFGRLPASMLSRLIKSEPRVDGPATRNPSQAGTYTITNYDVFTQYTLSGVLGTATRSGPTITYTPGAAPGDGGFVLNGRRITVLISTQFPNQPVVTTPANASVDRPLSFTATSSAFGVSSGSDTHEMSDWQIATDSGFSNVVASSLASVTDLTSWNVTGLSFNTDYFIRVRHKGVTQGWSPWSTTSMFKTQVNTATLGTPNITAPASGATVIATNFTITASAFTVTNGSDTHLSTDWQIASDVGFTNIVKQSISNTTNKTSIGSSQLGNLVSGTVYYVRTRYRGTLVGYTGWSNPVMFTAQNAVITSIAIYNGGSPLAAVEMNEGSAQLLSARAVYSDSSTQLIMANWSKTGNDVTFFNGGNPVDTLSGVSSASFGIEAGAAGGAVGSITISYLGFNQTLPVNNLTPD